MWNLEYQFFLLCLKKEKSQSNLTFFERTKFSAWCALSCYTINLVYCSLCESVTVIFFCLHISHQIILLGVIM
jgi:hypothetical protein